MKIIQRLILTLCCITFFISCKKSGDGYVDGYVYETGTNTPVSGVEISIEQRHNGNQGELLSTTTSDASGHYALYYYNKLNSSYSYYVMVKSSPNSYFEYQEKKVTNKKEKNDFYVSAHAYLKFNVINNTPNAFSLSVLANDNYSSTVFFGGPPNSNAIYSTVLEVKGYSKNNITWNFLNNKYSDTIFIGSKNDTTVYTITLN